ncbi:MAG: glutathione S-transferase [Hyphomicrobiales bacterium]|nr:MAG: glutathione S-transferase [Hyphomicrobiales bacterium]
MKLYVDNNRAPNPRRVRIFIAEKGIDVPTEIVDLGKLEHKTDTFTALNPMQRLPVLVLDDGTVISESVAISRYFEELYPEPPLFGVDARDRAIVEMWNRRMDLNLGMMFAAVFRHSHPAMAAMEVPQVPEWAEANRPKLLDYLAFMDKELAGRPFIAGERFTIADITAVCIIDFLRPARVKVPEELTNLHRWHAEVSARPGCVQ